MGQEILKQIRQKLVDRYVKALGDNLVALAFFGSCARGEGTEASDIDVLLIAEELPRHPWERGRLIYRPIKEPSWGRIAVLARTVEEFTADVSPLHLDLAEDAIIIYDPQGFLTAKLDRVQELIEEAGLVRERTSGGLVWWWKDTPPRPGHWAITWEGFSVDRSG